MSEPCSVVFIGNRNSFVASAWFFFQRARLHSPLLESYKPQLNVCIVTSDSLCKYCKNIVRQVLLQTENILNIKQCNTQLPFYHATKLYYRNHFLKQSCNASNGSNCFWRLTDPSSLIYSIIYGHLLFHVLYENYWQPSIFNLLCLLESGYEPLLYPISADFVIRIALSTKLDSLVCHI